jgi:hypothetical protein
VHDAYDHPVEINELDGDCTGSDMIEILRQLHPRLFGRQHRRPVR